MSNGQALLWGAGFVFALFLIRELTAFEGVHEFLKSLGLLNH